MSLNINDFTKDYNDHMPICEICAKYGIGNTTYFKILKQAKIKRRISSKTNRLFNVIVDKKDDNLKQVYHKQINDPNITVVKKTPPKPPPKNTDSNVKKALTDAKQCIDKVKDKYSKKTGGDNTNNDIDNNDNNDKSALLQAIQKSNNIRSKLLNKKHNI